MRPFITECVAARARKSSDLLNCDNIVRYSRVLKLLDPVPLTRTLQIRANAAVMLDNNHYVTKGVSVFFSYCIRTLFIAQWVVMLSWKPLVKT
jgi:hypothetical protein